MIRKVFNPYSKGSGAAGQRQMEQEHKVRWTFLDQTEAGPPPCIYHTMANKTWDTTQAGNEGGSSPPPPLLSLHNRYPEIDPRWTEEVPFSHCGSWTVVDHFSVKVPDPL